MEPSSGHLRIGELSRRVGVSPELLRAWERRYGILRPMRTPGGFRLYSEADEARIRSMQQSLESGLSAAEAAQAALLMPAVTAAPALDVPELQSRLYKALTAYDDAAAQAALDTLLATYSVGTVLAEVILPVVRSMGEGWVEGSVTIAQEHFASNLIRGRLLGLARGWGQGTGPVAVLACPPGEQHDLPLIVFGITLREAGWRIAFLGADTPIETIASAAASLHSKAVVLSAATARGLDSIEKELGLLARNATVFLGGPGARQALADRLGAVMLNGDPVEAARRLASGATT